MTNRPTSGPPTLHKPRDAAKLLGCSEWWLKEQARRERIPFAWISGSYRFTDHHLVEIVAIFERRPTQPTTATTTGRERRRPRASIAPVVQLQARIPRRAQRAQQHLNPAA